MEHGYFGTIVFEGGTEARDDDYWESEIFIDGLDKPLLVLITAGKEGPNNKHESLCKELTSDLDALFEKCWPIFKPDFKIWTKKEFSGNWRDDFELEVIVLPKDANLLNEWEVGYYVEAASGHNFTACFVNGLPKYNRIDG